MASDGDFMTEELPSEDAAALAAEWLGNITACTPVAAQQHMDLVTKVLADAKRAVSDAFSLDVFPAVCMPPVASYQRWLIDVGGGSFSTWLDDISPDAF